MSVLDKGKIIDSLHSLPEKTTIEKGIRQSDKGQCISNEEAKEKIRKWLK